MKIHKEGYRIIMWSTAVLTAFNILTALAVEAPGWIAVAILAVSVALLFFLAFFFRAPERVVAGGERTVVSPADGKIVIIGEAFEKEYLKKSCLQISVFMSPLNVHCNRYPVSGTVKEVIYHPGRYLVAWHPKSSDLNERSTVVIETHEGETLVVRQIAGFLARRIVTYARPGQKVTRGDELGFIKFGSRVDLFLPEGFTPKVELNQPVKGNITLMGSL